MLNRLIANWVYGGFLAGILLLFLLPVLAAAWPPALLATFLCLPAYMLHQYEEHDNDRFRTFVNLNVGKGKDVLSPLAVFINNVPGVWGVIGISFCLTAVDNPGYGLIAVYLVIVNALVHIIPAVIFRSYNPGVATAIALFLPVGGYGLLTIQNSREGTIPMHAAGLAIAIAIHAAIVICVKRR